MLKNFFNMFRSLQFYATMCALYSTMGIIWLIICLWKWRDILRIQMWIGAVLFLGMLEMVFFLHKVL